MAEEKRTKRVPLEMTPAEHAALKRWADGLGLKMGPAIRAALYRLGVFSQEPHA